MTTVDRTMLLIDRRKQLHEASLYGRSSPAIEAWRPEKTLGQ